MVYSLRGALRLLPSVRVGIGGPSIGLCYRISKTRIHSSFEQSPLLALKSHPQVVNCEKALPGGVGIIRFARAVLAYVGAGVSAVAANQFTGPSIFQAKELGNSVGENNTRGAAKGSGMWQRTSASRHVVQEEVIRSPKFAHCPLPHIASKSKADACYTVAHFYHWNNGWGPVDVRFFLVAKGVSPWQSTPSTIRDHRSKLGGFEDGLNNRFSKPTGLQALTADRSFSLKSNVGPMGSVSDYSAAAELEMEWQFIVEHKSKAGLETLVSDGRNCAEDEQATFQVVGNNLQLDEPDSINLKNAREAGSEKAAMKTTRDVIAKHVEVKMKSNEEIMTKSKEETMAILEYVHGDIDNQHNLISMQGPVFRECAKHQCLDSWSSKREGLLWRTVDKEGSNLLGAPNTAEGVEDFKIPSASAESLSGMPLSIFDIIEKEGDKVLPMQKNLLAALLHRKEPTQLENSCLHSSILPGSSDRTGAAPIHFQTTSQPLIIPSIVARARGSQSLSADSRRTSWNGGCALSSSSDRASGLLGEALCHSQTRAREAEEQVQQAFEEQERLLRLLFREASRALTYQQWVTSLQIENMWLKNSAPHESLAWFHRSFVEPLSTMGRKSSSWKDLDKNHDRCQMEHNVSAMREKDAIDLGESSSNDIVMGYTLGIAFALGLSLAGAGLMIGWSMGWILLAYSVSV